MKSELHRLPRHLAMASPGWEIRSTWSVAESDSSFEDFVLIHDIRNSSETGALDKRLRLIPGPEKQSCEVTGILSSQ